MPVRRAASALAAVPPFALTKAGLYEPSEVRSNVLSYTPLVTPRGNPVKVGVVVATMAVEVPGLAVALWMCEAVVVPRSPANDTWTCRLLVAGSKSTSENPVPGEVLGGLSPGPVRVVRKTIEAAWEGDVMKSRAKAVATIAR
jgi:hypothetical protein